MLRGRLDAEFPFGVLLVTDAGSTRPVPGWATADEQVTTADTALVVRVLHADEGAVSVRVWDTDDEVAGVPLFTGAVDLPSGVLRVSDAYGEQGAEWVLGSGRHELAVFADAGTEATVVDVVI